MSDRDNNSAIGLLLSGGLDSCILLGHLAGLGHRVQPFYIRSQLHWEEEEQRAVRAFLQAVGKENIEKLVVLEMPLKDLYGRHWSTDGQGVPDAHSADDAVYLPGRNALLIIKASIWCRLNGIGQLALAVLGSNPFGDATSEFFDDLESALDRATGGRVRVVRPFAQLDKQQVMRLGRDLPLELTFSCIAPVDGLHCGVCNKCAERQKAFRLIDMEDPTKYVKRMRDEG
ncbi:MAG: 7-cyano-7-deazaguanine synthase [Thermoguttaceae bacterium]|jgi:7-cyano-7-deazaguanine synthase